MLRDVVRKAARIALPIQSVHGTGSKKNVTRRKNTEKRVMEGRNDTILSGSYFQSAKNYFYFVFVLQHIFNPKAKNFKKIIKLCKKHKKKIL